MQTSFRAVVAALAVGGLVSPAWSATTIVGNVVTVDWNDDPNGASPPAAFAHGRIINNQYSQGNGIIPGGSGLGFTVTAINTAKSFDLAVLYNSDLSGEGADTDLERSTTAGAGNGPRTDWAGGNLVGQSLGNLLIVQENAPTAGEISAGQLTTTAPDDEGTSDAATLRFTFEAGILSFGWGWADLDDPADTYVRFVDYTSGVYAQIDFRQFSDAPVGNTANGDYYERPGVVWDDYLTTSETGDGDGFANSFTAVTIAEITGSASVADSQLRDEGPASGFQLVNTTRGWRFISGDGAAPAPVNIDEVEFHFGGSGGIAFISYEVVPEPATVAAWVGGLALALAVVVRRRRTAGR